MRAFAQHNVQQNDCHFRISRLLPQTANAQIVVQHGMQAPDGKFVAAQIDDGVSLTMKHVAEQLVMSHWDVGVQGIKHCLETEQRFISQRTAGKQAA